MYVRGALRIFFIILGLISFGLGALGVVLPILPTTPFILLSAYLFLKSSPRLHAWLLRHPRFGPMIIRFQRGDGLTLRVKLTSLFMAYTMVVTSMIVVNILYVRLFLGLLIVIMTVTMIRIPTCPPDRKLDVTECRPTEKKV